MFGMGKNKLSTENYKGVRDFFPEDKALQNYIFKTMRSVVESWGYIEYDASVLEPFELYKSKTSEEILNEQIYSFKDRAGRDVALRPEMTPTVSRMISLKIQELPIPIRWYSIPNVFRYEKPQRGRLREHWQLNVDLFGVNGVYAEAEVISVACQIMKKFGAKDSDFVIKINSRNLLNDLLDKVGIDKDKIQFVYRLLDKKEKIDESKFRTMLGSLVGEKNAENILETIYFGEGILSMTDKFESLDYLKETIKILRDWGVSNLVFDPTLTRGFDYYTGVVFEVFDASPENNRSLFGGGRYDNLTNLFIDQSIPAFGFGMGDVTVRDFLLTHNLIPKIDSTVQVYICVAGADLNEVYKISNTLRSNGVSVAIDLSGKKLADQLKSLDKRKVPFVLTIGPDEIIKQIFTLRNTETREEKSGNIDEIINKIKNIS